jgi:hypothetical protein
VAGVLGGSHPCSDVAVLAASELVTNSVRHSCSAATGGLGRRDDLRLVGLKLIFLIASRAVPLLGLSRHE